MQRAARIVERLYPLAWLALFVSTACGDGSDGRHESKEGDKGELHGDECVEVQMMCR